jgi:hypothetical protein
MPFRPATPENEAGLAALFSALAAVGYGLLRCWAEGFAVPSLGIAAHPDHRGRGAEPA